MDPTDLPSNICVDPTSIPDSAFVASGACVIGDVRLCIDSSIWYNAVVRGDINYIEIGARSNVQDGCIVHVTNAQPCVVGADVTVGHGVNLHACTVEDGCLIGMGAIILSGAHIGRGSVVGAGSVVREGAVVKPFNLAVGVPARSVRTLPESTYQTHCKWAKKYVRLARAHGDTR